MTRVPVNPSGGPAAITDNDETAVPAPIPLTDAEREALLGIARAAVAAAAGAGTHAAVDRARELFAGSGLRASVFVTLTEDGELRGCMGHLDPDLPVADSVVEAASCAALLDPRFRRVSAAELDRIEIEVSVLGPMLRLGDPEGFRIGTEGVVVRLGLRRGLLLPDVAAQLDFSRVAMLETACRKAGLPAGAWRYPEAAVFAFRTDRFGGPAAG